MKDVVCAYSQCYKGKGGRRRRANHVCPHCHTVGYCCADCRTKDWPNHRKNCLILQKEDWKKKTRSLSTKSSSLSSITMPMLLLLY